MSTEEIIELLERQAQKYEVCARCDALSPLAPKYQDSARLMRAAIEKLRTNTPEEDNADKNSDTSARLAAIKDIPTQRLIELAVAEAAGLISISTSAADVEPVRHGRWDGDTCTCCKLPWNYHMEQNADDWGYFDPMPAFCPNCGAKMDGEVTE